MRGYGEEYKCTGSKIIEAVVGRKGPNHPLKNEKNPLTRRELFKAIKNRAVYPLVRARTQNILLHHLYCRFCPFGWFIPVCLRRLARDDTYGRQGQVLLQ